MIKIVFLYIFFISLIFGQTVEEIQGEITFETGIHEITIGDPIRLQLSLSPLDLSKEVANKIINKDIADSFNIINIVNKKEDRGRNKLILNMTAIFFKKYEMQAQHEVEIEDGIKIIVKIPDVKMNDFNKESSDIIILDSPYPSFINWKNVFIIILLMLVSTTISLWKRFVKNREKRRLEKIRRDKIKKLQNAIYNAKTRRDVEDTSVLIKEMMQETLLLQDDINMNKFLLELEKIQYKKDWNEEEVNKSLNDLKTIKVF